MASIGGKLVEIVCSTGIVETVTHQTKKRSSLKLRPSKKFSDFRKSIENKIGRNQKFSVPYVIEPMPWNDKFGGANHSKAVVPMPVIKNTNRNTLNSLT